MKLLAVLAAIFLLAAGCVAPTKFTGGSVQRADVVTSTPVYSPTTPKHEHITIHGQWFSDHKSFDLGPTFVPTTIDIDRYFFDPAVNFATTTDKSVATTQPTYEVDGHSETKITPPEIKANGALGPGEFVAKYLQPKFTFWNWALAMGFGVLGAFLIFLSVKFGLVPLWLGPGIIVLGVLPFFLEPEMLTIVVLSILALAAIAIAVYYFTKHGQLQTAVAETDSFLSGLVHTGQVTPAQVAGNLNDPTAAKLPATSAAVSTVALAATASPVLAVTAAATPPPAAK